MVSSDYINFVIEKLKTIKNEQIENIEKGARLVAEVVKNDGRIYIFGTGHSHIVAEDIYLRAGGLALVKAILEPALMLHEFPNKSTYLERLDGYGKVLFKLYKITSQDILILVSNSGRNNVVVEMALEAKKNGTKIIAITSIKHSQKVDSRHKSGKKLFEIADVVIDNYSEYGDAAYFVKNFDVPLGPTSSITGTAIIQSLMVSAVNVLVEEGIIPPVFRSSNLDGADEYNDKLFEKYYGYWK
jgi:uncharacterized phosphosugar-binding protein